MLDICLLGTGGMMPLPDRWLTSLLLRYNGKMMLIDCGEGTQISMKQAGWGFKQIQIICFTHYHADHIAGLPGLLLTIGNSGKTDALTILGPPELLNVIKGLTIISPELPYDLILKEISLYEEEKFVLEDFCLSSIPVDHTIPCLSYKVEIKRERKFSPQKAKEQNIPVSFWSLLQKGKTINHEDRIFTPDMVLGEERRGIKVVYCTDTRPTESLIDFIENVDLFIAEGMYGEKEKRMKAEVNKHMLFSEAAILAKKGKVRELWLTHYSPSLPEPEVFINNAKDIFENVILGKDLMKRALHFQE